MKRSWVLTLIGVGLSLLLALVFAYPRFMVAPGPLLPAHADLAGNCFACHAPWRGAAPERCLSCHKLADIGLRTTKGLPIDRPTIKLSFHQELSESNCVGCHRDHEEPKLTHRFKKPFTHELLKLDTRARCSSCHAAPADALHRELTVNCSQCHQPDRWQSASFDHAQLSADLKTRCESCHRPPADEQHAGMSGNCQQCHAPMHWKPSTFDHAKLFLLQGEHNAKCATCHVNNDTSRYTCYGCHEHQPNRIRAKHHEEGITRFDNCVECHRSADDGERDEHD
jgi:hypothetical protein